MEPVRYSKEESSLIESVQFDESTWTLDVHMHNKNSYSYSDVPPEVYDEFLRSPSKGSFYNRNIKGKFESLNHKDLPAQMPETPVKDQLRASMAEQTIEGEPFDITRVETDFELNFSDKPSPIMVVEEDPNWPPQAAFDAIPEDDALEVAGGAAVVEPEVVVETALVTVAPINEVMGKLATASKQLSVFATRSAVLLARPFVVTNNIDYLAVQTTVKEIKQHGIDIAAVIDPIRETFYRAYNAVQTKQKEALDPLNAAIRVANQVLNAYDTKLENEARERQRLADKAAAEASEARRRQESERLTLAAVDDHLQAGDTDAAERLFADPIEAPSQPVYAERVYTEAPITKGVSKRKNWGGEVTDFEALVLDVAEGIKSMKASGNVGGHAPINFLEANMTAVNQACKALEANAKYPGIMSRNNAVRSTRV